MKQPHKGSPTMQMLGLGVVLAVVVCFALVVFGAGQPNHSHADAQSGRTTDEIAGDYARTLDRDPSFRTKRTSNNLRDPVGRLDGGRDASSGDARRELYLALGMRPGPRPSTPKPAAERLVRAREAFQRFSTHARRLIRERDAAQTAGADTTALDERIDMFLRRADVAQVAELGIREEMGEPVDVNVDRSWLLSTDPIPELRPRLSDGQRGRREHDGEPVRP